MIMSPNADLNIGIIGVVFGAVGTVGQRCTTTRRLIIHESIYEDVKFKLIMAYKQIKIGNPLDENNHMGPLIDTNVVEAYENAIAMIEKEGGKLLSLVEF